MRNFAIICLLVASLFIAPAAFSKEVATANTDGDSATSKLSAIYGTELNTKAKDFKVSWKAGKGLTFKSGDAFKLSLGARIQARMDTWEKSDDTQDGRGYELGTRRFQIALKGYAYSPNIFYKYVFNSDKNGEEIAGGTKEGGLGIEDAYFGYKKGMFKVTFGQMKIPFDIEEQTSSSSLEFVDRSAKRLIWERDHGVKFDLSPIKNKVKLTYYLGSGTGGNNTESFFKQSGNTDDHIHAYRIDLTPLGKYKYKQGDLKGGDLKIGIGAAYVTWNNLSVNAGYEIQNDAGNDFVKGKLDDILDKLEIAFDNSGQTTAASTDFDVSALTYDFRAKMKGFAYEFNYSKITGKDQENAAVGKASTDFYRHQISYTSPGGYMIGYRYSLLDESTGDNSNGDNFIEQSYGVGKYFVGHNLKLQATYIDLKEEKPGDDADDDIFMIQAQMKF